MRLTSRIGAILASALALCMPTPDISVLDRPRSAVRREQNIRKVKAVVKQDRKAQVIADQKAVTAAEKKRQRRIARNIRNQYSWQPASKLPLPDAPLLILMENDVIFKVRRMDYVSPSEKDNALDFYDLESDQLVATGRFPWTYP